MRNIYDLCTEADSPTLTKAEPLKIKIGLQ